MLVVIQNDFLVERVELHHTQPNTFRTSCRPRTKASTLLGGVVEVERRPSSGRHSETDAHRVGTVVADPHLHSERVEHLAHVVRVDTSQDERDRAAPVHHRVRPDDPQVRNGGQGVQRVRGELPFVLRHRLHADTGQIVDRCGQAHRLGDRRRARLEPGRRRRVGGPLHRHGLDHRPAAEDRGHRREQVGAPPQHTDAGRATHLVSGEGEEVHAKLSHVHRPVRHRLGGVEHHQRTDLAGSRDDPRGRVHGAEDVGLVHE